MKIKQALREMANLEYGSKEPINAITAETFEKAIINTMYKAIQLSPELQKKFGLDEPPFDIQISQEKGGIVYHVTCNPEDGTNPRTINYSKMAIERFVNNPKGMAIALAADFR